TFNLTPMNDPFAFRRDADDSTADIGSLSIFPEANSAPVQAANLHAVQRFSRALSDSIRTGSCRPSFVRASGASGWRARAFVSPWYTERQKSGVVSSPAPTAYCRRKLPSRENTAVQV